MSSAGSKKNKKKKGVTVNLYSFLADGNGPTPSIPLKSSNWADDVEDDHEGFSSRSSKDPVILPTAPRAARGPGIDEENIPTNPPYVAYISNLPYDVDETDLADFFADMKISNMRLPKDASKIRGYGYVEFEDRQSLIDALSMTNTTIKTRRVRIEVSNSSNDDRRGGRMGRDNRRDNYDDPERTSGDWRSGPREDLLDGDSYRSRYDRDRRDDRERHDYDNKPGAWRERDSNDKGSSFKDRGGFRDDSRDRDRDRDWNRYGDRGRSRDRDGDRSSSFGPRRNYGDSDWDRDRRQDRDPKSEPRQRPKLQLQPRTKPVESIVAAEDSISKDGTTESKSTANSESTQRAPTSVPAANIFGAAKPVDTTAREREIEERLAKSYAESRSREETDTKERRDGTWGRRNGEGRDDKDKDKDKDKEKLEKDKEKEKGSAWRSEEDKLEKDKEKEKGSAWRSEEDKLEKDKEKEKRSAWRSEEDKLEKDKEKEKGSAWRSEEDKLEKDKEKEKGSAWRSEEEKLEKDKEKEKGSAWRSEEDKLEKDKEKEKGSAWQSEEDKLEKDKEKEKGSAWRSEEDKKSVQLERSTPRSQQTLTRSEEQSGSKASLISRSGPPTSKGSQKPVEKDTRAAEKDRKDKEKDEISRMPKAKDDEVPNFVASNKYSMLPDDVDPDNIDE